MKPYYSGPGVVIYCGDCREVLPTLAPVETCLTDPPYGLGFMGKGWDHAVPGIEFWKAVSGALKPGGHLLAFGGTRLWHRLATAIEDSGFDIRDTLMWLYGSGFPKSLDVAKSIDKAHGNERGKRGAVKSGNAAMSGPNFERTPKGTPIAAAAAAASGWGTALKPAWEPIILARKPLDGTVAANVQAHGTGALNIDGCRIGSEGTRRSANAGTGNRDNWRTGNEAGVHGSEAGRWPANLILDEESAALLDEQSGELTSGGVPDERAPRPPTPADVLRGAQGTPTTNGIGPNTGGASRFFYTAKASRSEREWGLDGMPLRAGGVHDDDGHREPGERKNNHTAPRPTTNDHPTVKPLDLMRWLARLTKTPTGGTVLDPFMGSGSTLVAAREEFRPVIGIELDERYCEIAARRLSQGVLDFGAA